MLRKIMYKKHVGLSVLFETCTSACECEGESCGRNQLLHDCAHCFIVLPASNKWLKNELATVAFLSYMQGH